MAHVVTACYGQTWFGVTCKAVSPSRRLRHAVSECRVPFLPKTARERNEGKCRSLSVQDKVCQKPHACESLCPRTLDFLTPLHYEEKGGITWSWQRWVYSASNPFSQKSRNIYKFLRNIGCRILVSQSIFFDTFCTFVLRPFLSCSYLSHNSHGSSPHIVIGNTPWLLSACWPIKRWPHRILTSFSIPVPPAARRR